MTSKEALQHLKQQDEFSRKNGVKEEYLYTEEIESIENELNKYAEIEEELGIDLVTLFKASKKCYVNDTYGTISYNKNKIECCKGLIIDFEEKALYGLQYGTEIRWTYYFKDYGKTWALTREELEH